MGEFKELNIDRSKLEDEVAKYMSSKDVLNYNFTPHPKFKRLEYSIDHAKVMVDFYEVKNGTTTIRYNIGSNPELGKELANYLYDNLVTDERKNLSLSVSNFNQSDYNELLEAVDSGFLQDAGDFELTLLKEDSNKSAINIKSIKYDDSVVVTFYKTTQKVLIQGKPLHTFSQLTYFLSEFTDIDGFLNIIEKHDPEQKVKINTEAIQDLFELKMKNSIGYLGESIKKMLLTSLSLDSMSDELPDYTYIAFPALRALEGVLKAIFFEKGILVSDHKFAGIFFKNIHGKFKLTGDMELQLDTKMWAPLCDCYQYFHSQRHTLFHTQDFVEGSRMIEKKEEASNIIQTTLKIIDDTYLRIK